MNELSPTSQRIDFDTFRGLLIPYLQAIGVKLRQAGPGALIGRCPIHQEKHGMALAVYADGHWRCFGKCARGGDVIDLDCALNGGEIADAVKRIRAMNLGEPLALDQYDEREQRAPIVITPENPLGLPYFLSAREREICANCAHRLARSNYWLSQVASLKGWKKETICNLALEGDLGVDPAARICFNYESGLNSDTTTSIRVNGLFGGVSVSRPYGA